MVKESPTTRNSGPREPSREPTIFYFHPYCNVIEYDVACKTAAVIVYFMKKWLLGIITSLPTGSTYLCLYLILTDTQQIKYLSTKCIRSSGTVYLHWQQIGTYLLFTNSSLSIEIEIGSSFVIGKVRDHVQCRVTNYGLFSLLVKWH